VHRLIAWRPRPVVDDLQQRAGLVCGCTFQRKAISTCHAGQKHSIRFVSCYRSLFWVASLLIVKPTSFGIVNEKPIDFSFQCKITVSYFGVVQVPPFTMAVTNSLLSPDTTGLALQLLELQPAESKCPVCLNFACVCPEPVLVNVRFWVSNGARIACF
jgi:hypothetical protein